MSRRAWPRSLAVIAALAACAPPSGTVGNGAPVRGEWTFSGTQSAPQATLSGSLTIQQQDGDLITGVAGWDERDAAGVVRPSGGAVSGRVLGEFDIDFDVTAGGITRRHVGRIHADTITGSWVQLGDGRSGSFRLERRAAGGLP